MIALAKLLSTFELSKLGVYLAGFVALATVYVALCLRQPSSRLKVPPAVGEHTPFLGAGSFWSERWSFFQRASALSTTGNFSFWAGRYHVVGLSGDAARRVFYNNKSFGIAEGYAIIGGNLPSAHVEGEQGEDIYAKGEFLDYLKERVRRMVSKDALRKRLPILVADTIEMTAHTKTLFNPFEHMYLLTFRLMMRGVGSDDIASNPQLLKGMLHHYECFSASATRVSILFSWLPTRNLIKRYYYGAKLFLTLRGVVRERFALSAKGLRPFEDPLQELIDGRCGESHTVGIILGAVFAGQQNTEVNAAWLLVHLAHNKTWADRIRSDIRAAAKKYAPDAKNLVEALRGISLEVWEQEFPSIEMSIKENLRLHGLGTQIRRNVGADVILPETGEVVPAQSFVAYHTADIHLDSSMYPNPLHWDPERYLPERAQDAKKPLAWAGWGSGRHMCAGMRMAQLDLTIMVAVYLATYDVIELCDADGKQTKELPKIDLEAWISGKPLGRRAWLKISRVAEARDT